MKRVFLLLALFGFASFVSTIGAETIMHDFDAMYNAVPRELETSNSNKTGTIGDFVYTGSGSGMKFWLYNSQYICIFMEATNDEFYTTEIENLKKVHFMILPSGTVFSNLQISYSTNNGANWTVLPSENIERIKGNINATMPAVGNYCVKVKRTSGSNAYIQAVEYTTEPPCRCMTYELHD